MADSNQVNGSANRRAQIIAGQALREAAAAPTNWRAKRKRRSFTNWNTPPATPSPIEAAEPAADASEAPAPTK